jgi:CheY-like chemotaxis protein
MPQLDGAGLIAALRRSAATEERTAPPIVLTTAFAQMPRAALDAIGADATLFMPFTMEQVLRLLERFLPHLE